MASHWSLNYKTASDWAETVQIVSQGKNIHHPLALWHIMPESSSATRPLLAPGWPIRSKLWAELTNQRLGLCPTLHPAGQWLSGYLCRLYYLYQLWWITWGCSLIVQWFGFQEKQIKKSLGNISSSLKPCCHFDEGTLWWRSHSWIHPPCTRGSQANYR